MKYEVKYQPDPVWRGRTKDAVYTLHRAAISTLDGSWTETGYVLWWRGASETDTAEAYVDGSINPGSGIYGGLISKRIATGQQLPPPAQKDIVEFENSFRKLCESDGDPLLESRILV